MIMVDLPHYLLKSHHDHGAWLSRNGQMPRNGGCTHPTAKVECTMDTASGWVITTSDGGTDWGYNE
jgi:hypothetical protein